MPNRLYAFKVYLPPWIGLYVRVSYRIASKEFTIVNAVYSSLRTGAFIDKITKSAGLSSFFFECYIAASKSESNGPGLCRLDNIVQRRIFLVVSARKSAVIGV